MHLQNAAVSFHALNTASFYIFIFSFFFITNTDASSDECSKTCVVEKCDSIGIRYGKYCGVGWTGCTGEKPCDDLDACCQIHDHCVAQNGMTNMKCHEECKSCIKRVEKSGNVGFSNKCPYEAAVSTLIQWFAGIEMPSDFSFSECVIVTRRAIFVRN